MATTANVDLQEILTYRYFYSDFTDFKAMAGYDLGPALAYVTAGYSMAGFTASRRTGQVSGWVAGAGVDVKVTEHIFVGGEYLYRDLYNPDFYYTGGYLHGQISSWQVRAGYRF